MAYDRTYFLLGAAGPAEVKSARDEDRSGRKSSSVSIEEAAARASQPSSIEISASAAEGRGKRMRRSRQRQMHAYPTALDYEAYKLEECSVSLCKGLD